MSRICFCLLLLLTNTFAQQINIKIDSSGFEKASLYYLEGETAHFIDSVKIFNNMIQLDFTGSHSGFYRLSFNSKILNFIYDNDDVEIEADLISLPDRLRIIKSESNRIYQTFVKLNKDYKTKSELLQLILSRYPGDDDYYALTKETLIRVQKDYHNFINQESQENPGSFIARYVRSAQLPAIYTDDQPDYLKSRSLDKVDFFDEKLIYSDLFTSKSIEYLSYYRNPRLPLEILEKEFMKAADSILIRAKVNSIVYRHITGYLLNGFKQFGFDNVLNYITEYYIIKDDICLDEKLGTALERRIQQAKKFKPGVTVPNIILTDKEGFKVNLAEINAGRILIIFYASRCPHCKDLLPEIYNYREAHKEKNLEVVAVSLDSSRTDWINFVTSNKLNWINVSDLKSWDGEAAIDYQIYATPAMFLVDQYGKLIGIPRNLNEIISFLNN